MSAAARASYPIPVILAPDEIANEISSDLALEGDAPLATLSRIRVLIDAGKARTAACTSGFVSMLFRTCRGLVEPSPAFSRLRGGSLRCSRSLLLGLDLPLVEPELATCP